MINEDDLVKQIDEFPTMPSFLDILEMIKEAPTIEPKRGEWIPCSERLPRGDVQVLVSVSVADAPWSIILMSASSVGEYYRRGHIDAWMPLPKPYRERKEDK